MGEQGDERGLALSEMDSTGRPAAAPEYGESCER